MGPLYKNESLVHIHEFFFLISVKCMYVYDECKAALTQIPFWNPVCYVFHIDFTWDLKCIIQTYKLRQFNISMLSAVLLVCVSGIKYSNPSEHKYPLTSTLSEHGVKHKNQLRAFLSVSVGISLFKHFFRIEPTLKHPFCICQHFRNNHECCEIEFI